MRREGGGTRTHDLGIKSPLLYQLSYAPVRPNLLSRSGKLNPRLAIDATGRVVSSQPRRDV
jgi:hypothetical protein